MRNNLKERIAEHDKGVVWIVLSSRENQKNITAVAITVKI